MNFDRVLVLGQGSVLEFDSPQNLLANPKSAFSEMVDSMGPAQSEALRAMTSTKTTAPLTARPKTAEVDLEDSDLIDC